MSRAPGRPPTPPPRWSIKRVFAVSGAGLAVLVVIGLMIGDPGEDDPPPARSTPTTSQSLFPSHTPQPTSTPRAQAAYGPVTSTTSRVAQSSSASDVERCFSPFDGNLSAMEGLIRLFLHDPGSMRTHDTRYRTQPVVANAYGDGVPPTSGYHTVVMDYSVLNMYGGRVRYTATGLVHGSSCRVILVHPGR